MEDVAVAAKGATFQEGKRPVRADVDIGDLKCGLGGWGLREGWAGEQGRESYARKRSLHRSNL
jgi:hypothetical protein